MPKIIHDAPNGPQPLGPYSMVTEGDTDPGYVPHVAWEADNPVSPEYRWSSDLENRAYVGQNSDSYRCTTPA
jgi:hypothetical protein